MSKNKIKLFSEQSLSDYFRSNDVLSEAVAKALTGGQNKNEIVKEIVAKGWTCESAIQFVDSIQIELLKIILKKDTVALLEPAVAVLYLLIILFVSTWWKDAVFFLFFLAGWTIFWIGRFGIKHALVAIFRLPYNAIRLYRMTKRLKSNS